MSAKLDSKSKRTSSSGNSNSTGGGDGNKKKKKTAQKTLGVAWGSGSSRSAFRSSPFSDFGSYMVVKNRKLHEQFDAATSSSPVGGLSNAKTLFSGVSIFVDGYTVPSSQELRGYMLKYGGRFENYFSRQRVTHIICSNLPSSKLKNLRAFSAGLPVVIPTWVVDSIAANKILSWMPYQLDQIAADFDNQPKLSAFFTLKNNGGSEVGDQAISSPATPENDIPGQDYSLNEESSASKLAERCCVEVDDPMRPADTYTSMHEEPACSVESSCDVKGVELSDASPSDRRDCCFKPTRSSVQDSVSLCSHSIGAYNNEASSSKTSSVPNLRHSTLTDPNFVENYFKSSRLHFIGTWRNRYCKRFPSSSSGVRTSTPSTNTAALTPNTAIIHIDMDCFFASVVIRNHPELLDKPVAVCHSDSPRGTAEISSANYPARDYGIKAGMFVKDAKTRCPQLVIVPYDFGAYEKVADQFYEILHKHCNKVQAISCDEAFLDVSESVVDDPQLLASTIRKEIIDTTGCTASAGIAANMLMARLATKTAKPDGQCYIPPEKVDSYLCTLPVKALPGIGRVLEEKLKRRQIETCGQLREFSKELLQKDFGMKTGEMLWNYSRGIDNRLVGVLRESKSIGAEVNWGVRFEDLNDTHHFLMSLCKEVVLRLQGCRVRGRSFTLKIKKRRTDAGEPIKYMGCGDCENLSHTLTIPMATDDVDELQRLATQLFGYFTIDVKDIRGVGLQVSKLEGGDDGKLVHKRNSIRSWLISTTTRARDHNKIGDVHDHDNADTCARGDTEVQGRACSSTTGSSARTGGASSSGFGSLQTATLPPLHDLDVAVLESLPPDIVSEINDMYGGKLLGFISENKGKSDHKKTLLDLGVVVEEAEALPVHAVEPSTIAGGDEELPHSKFPVVSASGSPHQMSLMPSSLSQVDSSVLQQLPEELRKDIIELLPLHRTSETVGGIASNVDDNPVAFSENNDLWVGNPPKWVEMFETTSCCILNNFAQMYRFGSRKCLSSLLQRMISGIHLSLEMGTDRLDDAINLLCELFKQYFELRIVNDIEEIYSCICLLRRLCGRSKTLLQVYNIVLPHLQVSVGEKYGGALDIGTVYI